MPQGHLPHYWAFAVASVPWSAPIFILSGPSCIASTYWGKGHRQVPMDTNGGVPRDPKSVSQD